MGLWVYELRLRFRDTCSSVTRVNLNVCHNEVLTISGSGLFSSQPICCDSFDLSSSLMCRSSAESSLAKLAIAIHNIQFGYRGGGKEVN